MAIPKEMRYLYDEIAELVSEFCAEHLDAEYEAVCLRLLEKLCRKRPSPLLAGKPQTWAAGIVYAICANNYIFSKGNPFHMAADDVAAEFNLAASTAGNKASDIRKILRLSSLDNQWLVARYHSEFDLSRVPPGFRAGFERFRR